MCGKVKVEVYSSGSLSLEAGGDWPAKLGPASFFLWYNVYTVPPQPWQRCLGSLPKRLGHDHPFC